MKTWLDIVASDYEIFNQIESGKATLSASTLADHKNKASYTEAVQKSCYLFHNSQIELHAG